MFLLLAKPEKFVKDSVGDTEFLHGSLDHFIRLSCRTLLTCFTYKPKLLKADTVLFRTENRKKSFFSTFLEFSKTFSQYFFKYSEPL